MMPLKMLLLTLFATTALQLGSGAAWCQPMNDIEYLRYADLVVRGTIVDYAMEEPTRAEWFGAGTLKPDWPYPITVLDLNSVEVIRGSWNSSEMQVIAEGGWPRAQHPTTAVILDGVSYDFHVGDDVVLCLRYVEESRGDMYVVGTDMSRFRQVNDGRWENVGDGTVRGLDKIVEVARWGALDRIVASAHWGVRGVVADISEEIGTPSAREGVVKLIVQEVLFGEDIGDEVEFRLIEAGRDGLSWGRLAPAMSKGEEWVVFLGQDERGYYAFGDRNAVLRIDGERILRSGRVPTKFTLPGVRRLAQEVRPNE